MLQYSLRLLSEAWCRNDCNAYPHIRRSSLLALALSVWWLAGHSFAWAACFNTSFTHEFCWQNQFYPKTREVGRKGNQRHRWHRSERHWWNHSQRHWWNHSQQSTNCCCPQLGHLLSVSTGLVITFFVFSFFFCLFAKFSPEAYSTSILKLSQDMVVIGCRWRLGKATFGVHPLWLKVAVFFCWMHLFWFVVMFLVFL